MKKVLFVLVIATLVACGGSASTEVVNDSTVVAQDSVLIDSLK